MRNSGFPLPERINKNCSFRFNSSTAHEFDKIANEQLFDFQMDWPTDVRTTFNRDMILIQNFISEHEEHQLQTEIEKTMKRMRYQYDHWDDAIHGYREREKDDWSKVNDEILQRIRTKAFKENILPQVHILDLAADGIIKPHVDSSRYCGSTIAGLSLFTDCIMRLRRIDENKYKQDKIGESTAQTMVPNAANEPEFNYFVDILLKRRSLYIMKDTARYNFTHEVLPTKSIFCGNEIIKDRRVSIICRNQA